jgi:hypothetical protein
LSSFFMYFLRSSYMQPCGWNCPRAEGQGSQKIVCFAHRILVFHFFSLLFFAHGSIWCHLQCDRYDLNVKFLIFFKNFYKVHSVEVWSQDPPVNKNNSSSLILTNLELNLRHVCSTWFGVRRKRPQKKGRPSNFH